MARSHLSVEDVLGPHGILASRLPGFEVRQEQLDMANAVAASLAEQTHCLAEAGTGVGKTFAYLVPALLHLSEQHRVILSTHTINLQEQLTQKDIPGLHAALPDLHFTVAILKGMGNYLCLQNLEGAARLGVLLNEDFHRLQQWAQETVTGDVAELDFSFPGWGEVCATTESCRRQECPYMERCFLYRARDNAAAADVVVVNHALFFSDLALRGVDPSLSLLPDYAAVIFDEAHHLEDVASRVFGAECSNYRVSALLSRLRHLHQVDVDAADLQRLDDSNRRLFDMLAALERQEFFLDEAIDSCGRDALEEAAHALASRLERLEERLLRAARDVPEDSARAKVEGHARTAGRIRDDLVAVFFHARENHFTWVEQSGSGRRVQSTLHLTPIRVADILADSLWPNVPTAVLTSATLATNNSFGYLRERLGIPPARDTIVGSPFDYRRQALLYMAAHLDPPSEAPGYQEGVIEEIRRILRITEGRAFVLFTSYRAMERAYDILAPELPYPCLRQGEASNTRLLEEFRETPNACLFGVQSFWEGVDVPGDALSCVIIDRLPFAVPDHPVHRARVQAIKDSGGDWFYDYVLPQAQIRLKQGFGRLVRTSTDSGIVCILDSRLARKSYGNSFRKSLPRCAVTTNMEEVGRFMQRIRR